MPLHIQTWPWPVSLGVIACVVLMQTTPLPPELIDSELFQLLVMRSWVVSSDFKRYRGDAVLNQPAALAGLCALDRRALLDPTFCSVSDSTGEVRYNTSSVRRMRFDGEQAYRAPGLWVFDGGDAVSASGVGTVIADSNLKGLQILKFKVEGVDGCVPARLEVGVRAVAPHNADEWRLSVPLSALGPYPCYTSDAGIVVPDGTGRVLQRCPFDVRAGMELELRANGGEGYCELFVNSQPLPRLRFRSAYISSSNSKFPRARLAITLSPGVRLKCTASLALSPQLPPATAANPPLLSHPFTSPSSTVASPTAFSAVLALEVATVALSASREPAVSALLLASVLRIIRESPPQVRSDLLTHARTRTEDPVSLSMSVLLLLLCRHSVRAP